MQIKKIKCAKNMKTKSIPLFHLTFFYPMSSITSGPYTGYSKKVMFKVFPRYKSSLHILLHPKDQATIMASQPIPPKVPPPEIEALWSGLMKTHWFPLKTSHKTNYYWHISPSPSPLRPWFVSWYLQHWYMTQPPSPRFSVDPGKVIRKRWPLKS